MHAAHMNKKPKKLHKKSRRIINHPGLSPTHSLTHSPPNIFLLKENQTLIPHPDHKDQQQQKPTRVNPSSTALQITRNTFKLFTPQKTETHKSLSKTPLPKSQEQRKTQNRKHMSK
jgi:hypothetical protein